MKPTLTFKDATARRLWTDFCRKLRWRDRHLAPEDRRERQDEAVAHIAEAMANAQTTSETKALAEAIIAFGELETPPPFWHSPVILISNYLIMSLIAVCGFLVLALLHMALIELLNPDQVGLYWLEGDGWTLSYENQAGSRELLGRWFAPVAIGVSLILIGMAMLLYRVHMRIIGQNSSTADA